ncbi:MAG: C40 family peptidase [Clostridia bacterium]|nr:C40 family peptidase [Clostridia bacterium]
MNKILKIVLCMVFIVLCTFSACFAAITQQQGEDVAEFAKKFIEEGNSKKDENGFPLLTYALTGSWNKNVALRTAGYNAQMTNIKNNGYYISGGRYLNLGDKWAMDCGTTVLFLLKNTLGLELLTKDGEPWHVVDIYRDACKGENSEVFEFVYKDVRVGSIDYDKLQKGDVIGYYTSHGNHGMLYVGDGYIAHANRDMIKSWGNDKVSGFQVNKLNHYFLSGTHVRVYRIKDGVIPEDLVVNGEVTWPDTGETVDLLGRVPEVSEEDQFIQDDINALNEEIAQMESIPFEEQTDEVLLETAAKKEILDRLTSLISTKFVAHGPAYTQDQYVRLQERNII